MDEPESPPKPHHFHFSKLSFFEKKRETEDRWVLDKLAFGHEIGLKMKIGVLCEREGETRVLKSWAGTHSPANINLNCLRAIEDQKLPACIQYSYLYPIYTYTIVVNRQHERVPSKPW